MPLLTSRNPQHNYDVIVVGSGAAGGQTAYTKDLGYTGNLPLARFDGPPREILKRFGPD